jgi:3-isopropylmalate/(R)-2-methylmalate dehydratase large subunit
MGSTLTEKIIARASGRSKVSPGEIVVCRVDLAMMHDSGGPRRVMPVLAELNAGVWDPDKVVLVSDHYVPAVDAASAGILDLTRKWAGRNEIRNFYDMQGICHVVLPERGHLRPGMFVVGGDSHSPTGGAFGCFMFGVGATDMAGVLATGEIWVSVPRTIRIELKGALPDGVAAKDINLDLCRRLGSGGGEYQVVEFAGDALSGLSMQERMTLCNMTAELGAQTGIIAADETTLASLADFGLDPSEYSGWHGDDDAIFDATHTVKADALEPQVAAPHNPSNVKSVGHFGDVGIHQAYIGACTGAKLNDLHMAARVLDGQHVAEGVRLLIAPASTRITAEAAQDGTLATLTNAGAILMPSGCGACAGYGAGVLAENEVCISSTARNFQGRMGANSSQVYLGSPYTVAASAVAGRVADPRPFFMGQDHE